jgi:hypothetical protein
MNTPRSGDTATLLPNGKVLIAGGFINIPPYALTSTELYDPVANKFAPEGSTPVMNIGRDRATATLLSNGKVLIAGGGDSRTELYDPTTNKFAPVGSTAVMNNGGFNATATLLPNGKVLIAGGQETPPNEPGTTDLYDSATNTFAASPPGGGGFGSATATLLPNGKVLIAGGSTFSSHGLSSALNGTQLYDVATDDYVASPVMNTARDSATATLLPNGKVLIAGGIFFTQLPSDIFGTPLSSIRALHSLTERRAPAPCGGASL